MFIYILDWFKFLKQIRHFLRHSLTTLIYIRQFVLRSRRNLQRYPYPWNYFILEILHHIFFYLAHRALQLQPNIIYTFHIKLLFTNIILCFIILMSRSGAVQAAIIGDIFGIMIINGYSLLHFLCPEPSLTMEFESETENSVFTLLIHWYRRLKDWLIPFYYNTG